MPKKLNVSSNERIDIPDFEVASSGYTDESLQAHNRRLLLDRKSRFVNGFRVEVSDQTATPGQITVYNGDAIDHNGKPLHNEDQENASVTVTLSGASQTFYVEVEYTEPFSDADYRAFWDSTVVNTVPIPDGSEVALNVATRRSPSWRVVTPISTTGFQASTNPNSVRLPLVILRTNGSNVIDNTQNTLLTQVAPTSVLETDTSIGATTIRVIDSRLFGDSGNITVDFGGSPEVVTIISNDRENGIITVNPALAATHSVGAIVRSAATPRLIKENTNPNNSSLSAGAPNHVVDRQIRMFQGDETHGISMFSSKETFGARDDLNIRDLKSYVDFLSAQLREIKFGKSRADSNAAAPPPTSFPTLPRYYDAVGGLAGARTASISIGDGVNTYGDFNGTTEAPFIAAVAAASNGSTIFVKRGTYVFSNTVLLSNSIAFVGEGLSAVTVQNNVVAGPAFACNGGAIVFKNIGATTGTGTVNFLDCNGSTDVVVESCAFVGSGFSITAAATVRTSNSYLYTSVVTSTAGALAGSFDECLFSDSYLNGIIENVIMTGCTVNNSMSLATFTGTSSNSLSLINCDITTTGTTASLLAQNSTTTPSTVYITDSTLNLSTNGGSGEVVSLLDIKAANSSLYITSSKINVTAASTTALNRSFLVRIGQSAAANSCVVNIVASSVLCTANQYVCIIKNKSSTTTIDLSSCKFTGYNLIVNSDSSSIVNVTNCNVDTSAHTTIGAGVITYTNSGVISPTPVLFVSNNTFTGPTNTAVTQTVMSVGDVILSASNNTFRNFVNTSAALYVLSASPTQSSMPSSYSLSGNKIIGISSTFTNYLVTITGTTNTSVSIKGNEFTGCSLAAGVISTATVAEGIIDSNIIRNSTLGTSAISLSSYCSVTNNTIKGIATTNGTFSAIYVSSAANSVKINGNSILDITTAYVISIYGINAAGVITNGTINNNLIVGITATINNVTAVGIYFGGFTNGSISYNTIKSIGTDASATITYGMWSTGANPSYATFEGNYIESNGSALLGNYAINLVAASNSQAIKFIGNTIISYYGSTKNFAATQLVYFEKCTNFSFLRNDIMTSYGTSNALVLKDCTYFEVDGNNIQGGPNIGEGSIYVQSTTVALSTSRICGNRVSALSDGDFTTANAYGIYVDVSSTGFIGLNIVDNVVNYDKFSVGPADFYGIYVKSSQVTQRMLTVQGNTVVATGSSGYYTANGYGIRINNISGTDYLVKCTCTSNNVYIVGQGTPTLSTGINLNKVRFLSAVSNVATALPIGSAPGHTIEIYNCAGYYYTANILGDALEGGSYMTTGSTNAATAGYIMNMTS